MALIAASVLLCALAEAQQPPAQNREVFSPWRTPSPWQDDKGIIATVGSPFIELHVQPGRGYARFHAVEKHERIRIRKSRTDWFLVETADGKTGWAPRRALHSLYDEEGHRLDFGSPDWAGGQYPWQTGLMIGSYGGETAYTVFGGYRLTPHISAEIRHTQAFSDVATLRHTYGAVVHQTFPHWRYSPFFILGSGMVTTQPDATLVTAEDQDEHALTMGGGLMVYLTHKVMARIEYNYHTILTRSDINKEVKEWKFGFSVQF